MSTGPAQITSYQDLLALLKQQNVMHEADPASQSLQLPTVWNGIEGVQVIRWQDKDNVIQFIQSMPLEIPDFYIPPIESAIARLNHVMALPGLDLNHQGHIVSYRMALPLKPRGGVLPQEVQTCFRIALQTATGLVPTLRRVLSGDLEPHEVVADAQKAFPGPSAQAPGAPPFSTPFHDD
jgi:hypothetical protein